MINRFSVTKEVLCIIEKNIPEVRASLHALPSWHLTRDVCCILFLARRSRLEQQQTEQPWPLQTNARSRSRVDQSLRRQKPSSTATTLKIQIDVETFWTIEFWIVQTVLQLTTHLDLNVFTKLPITELALDGNPLCNKFKDSSTYVRYVCEEWVKANTYSYI